MGPLQFSLRTLFFLVTACAGACTFARHFGFGPIVIAAEVILLAAGWVWLFNLAPAATKYFTVFAIIGLCLFSLLSARLLQSRENARRNTSMNNARQRACQFDTLPAYDPQTWGAGRRVVDAPDATEIEP